jgi:hypothetical protein
VKDVVSQEQLPGVKDVVSQDQLPGVKDVVSQEQLPGVKDVVSQDQLPGVKDVVSQEQLPGGRISPLRELYVPLQTQVTRIEQLENKISLILQFIYVFFPSLCAITLPVISDYK